MTRNEAKTRMLEILDGLKDAKPTSLRRKLEGGGGCLLERLFGTDDLSGYGGSFKGTDHYAEIAALFRRRPSQIWMPNDQYTRGRITFDAFRAAIVALPSDEAA